jgi:hypothetical protein
MTTGWTHHGRRFLTLALGLGVMVLGVQGGRDAMNADARGSGLRCEIEVEEYGSGVQLQGIVFTKEAAQGIYEMQISSAGRNGTASIQQQGDFNAAANKPARLGIVQLRKEGGYDAELTVIWNGKEYRCQKHIGHGWL